MAVDLKGGGGAVRVLIAVRLCECDYLTMYDIGFHDGPGMTAITSMCFITRKAPTDVMQIVRCAWGIIRDIWSGRVSCLFSEYMRTSLYQQGLVHVVI